MKSARLIAIIMVATVMVSVLSIGAIAASPVSSTHVIVPESSKGVVAYSDGVVYIREDVPRSEAVNDPTYNAQDKKASEGLAVPPSRNVYWNIYGWKDYVSSGEARPAGCSAHMDGSTVLQTYHYTRTYLDAIINFRGDSGRHWATGEVYAYGTVCSQDVWNAYIHTVKYGTED